uniref:Uncharacterized protein n=1 Tax=Oryza glumipatula TaxID=40148 RepID=A0A0E0AS93_9ORYZ
MNRRELLLQSDKKTVAEAFWRGIVDGGVDDMVPAETMRTPWLAAFYLTRGGYTHEEQQHDCAALAVEPSRRSGVAVRTGQRGTHLMINQGKMQGFDKNIDANARRLSEWT